MPQNTAYNAGSLGAFHRLKDVNPILAPGDATFNCPFLGNVKWEELGIFNPAVVVKYNKVFCIYRTAEQDGFVTSIILNRFFIPKRASGRSWSSAAACRIRASSKLKAASMC